MKLSRLIPILILFTFSCGKEETNPNIVDITILQLNDVYEISPVYGGKLGGFARVKTLLDELKAENPNTYSILAGDMLSPSAIGVAKQNDNKIAGKQMVSILNAMDWDFFVFGNHEFDLKEPDLLKRLDEMKYTLIADNVLDKNNEPFPNTVKHQILDVEGLKIGIMGITLSSFNPKYANISDPIEKAIEVSEKMKSENVDIQLAITHLSIEEDEKLAMDVPNIDLIMGGHEHENIRILRGDDFTPITKADANGKTAFIHRLEFNKENKTLKINSELVFIDDQINPDPSIDSLVNYWTQVAYDAFAQKGFQPEKEVATITEVLDGSESAVRNRSTKLTRLITTSFLTAYPEADASILNGGTIRLDDKLQPGLITQYDLIRVSPFLGEISLVEMKGETLLNAIKQGKGNIGSGGFLHLGNIKEQDQSIMIGDQPLNLNKWYKVAITSYMVERGDKNLGFLTFDNGLVKKTDQPNKKFYDVIEQQFIINYPN